MSLQQPPAPSTAAARVRVVEVPAQAGPEQRRLCQAMAGVDRRMNHAAYGHTDLADPAARWESALADQRYAAKVLLVALAASGHGDDRALGWVSAAMPLTDNLRMAELQVVVDPATDVRGVVAALWQGLAPRLAARQRSVVQVWSAHGPAGPPDSRRLLPVGGAGHLDADPLAEALLGLGFVLEQVERYSILDVPGARDRARDLTSASGRAACPAYRPLTWSGPTPADLLAPLAALRSRMSVDAPTAGLDLEQEVWDADRVRHADRAQADAGRRVLTTAARHERSGQLVAYTQLAQTLHQPEVAFQDDTLVHGDHRGHRLGLLVKATTLVPLARHAPAVERIHTWNADENAHMLAINAELGFRAAGAEGGWQRRPA